MTGTPSGTRNVQGLRGKVTRREYGRGTKSERDALMLDTDEGAFLLRRRGGPAFGETGLDPMLGRVVECDGTIVDGRLLLVDRIGVAGAR